MGGLNGFEIHKDDGFLYGPLWFKGQVVKINLETGGIEVIAEGFKIPAAANIDPQNRDNVYVVDTGTGGIWSVSLTSKAKKLVASMKPGLDNLAFDSRGRLFVTSMTDNGIYLVDKQTGAHRTIVEGKLAIPADLAVVSEGGKDTVHVADVFSYRTVDGQTGAVQDVLRVHGETHAYPLGISVGPRHVLLTSWFSNTVEKVDRKTGKLVASFGEFAAPVDALETADGTIYVAELASSQPGQGQRRRQAALHRRQGTARPGGARAAARTTWSMSPRSPPARWPRSMSRRGARGSWPMAWPGPRASRSGPTAGCSWPRSARSAWSPSIRRPAPRR